MDPPELTHAERIFFEAVRYASDPASIGVFGTAIPAFMTSEVRRIFQRAVWQRYRDWTQPGKSDGPPPPDCPSGD